MKDRAFPEAYIWIAALLFLALTEPTSDHWTLCPLANAGFSFCPGCGLGTAISHLLHGDWVASWDAHPLALPAILILLFRVIQLFNNSTRPTTNYGTSNGTLPRITGDGT